MAFAHYQSHVTVFRMIGLFSLCSTEQSETDSQPNIRREKFSKSTRQLHAHFLLTRSRQRPKNPDFNFWLVRFHADVLNSFFVPSRQRKQLSLPSFSRNPSRQETGSTTDLCAKDSRTWRCPPSKGGCCCWCSQPSAQVRKALANECKSC